MANLRFVALACAAAAVLGLPDSSLVNTSEITWSGPESKGTFLGSPSIVRCSNGSLVVSHDTFGAGPTHNIVFLLRSDDNGNSWYPLSNGLNPGKGTISPMYWATLFARPGDAAIYSIGNQADGSMGVNQISIARSNDCGMTWTVAALTASKSISYSTGPTPVLAHSGRLWRVFEYNVGAGWASGYASVAISTPDNTTDLLDPTAWTLSGNLPFSIVSNQVPPSWSDPRVASAFGWLEGNAVEPVTAGDAGINIMLRVNSLPTANKAALLYLASPTATPQFVDWVEFPGGMTKFTVRRDPVTGVYVTLSNNIEDSAVTVPALCAPAAAPPPSEQLPSCNMYQQISCPATGAVPCYWTHAVSRNNLTLAVSADLRNWTVVMTAMQSETGEPEWVKQLFTGFQYVDFLLDGPEGADLLSAVRTAYRGAATYHNANRLLNQRIVQWRQYIPAHVLQQAAELRRQR